VALHFERRLVGDSQDIQTGVDRRGYGVWRALHHPPIGMGKTETHRIYVESGQIFAHCCRFLQSRSCSISIHDSARCALRDLMTTPAAFTLAPPPQIHTNAHAHTYHIHAHARTHTHTHAHTHARAGRLFLLMSSSHDERKH
jgi:hypothetical protein